MFIVFEGLDGAGKTTQAKMLRDRLESEGVKVEMVADPGTTALGLAIRQILLHSDEPITPIAQMLLFSAARAELAAHIRKRRAEGYVVICDRWIASTLVYQGVINGIDQELILEIFRETVALVPDQYVHLELSVETAQARVGKPRDRYESSSPEEWERKRQAYEWVRREPFAGKRRDMVDATLPPEELHDRVYKLYKSLVNYSPAST